MVLSRSAGCMPPVARCLAPLAVLLGLAATPARADLFVSSFNSNQVLEYNGTTGAFLGDFVGLGSGGLSDPTGLVFGPATSAIPEPGTLTLLGLGALSLAACAKRPRKQ